MQEFWCRINGREVKLTNLPKIFWPEEGFTKAQLIEYYIKIFPYISPHLQNRPLVVTRYPDGIKGKSFYQKNAPAHTPQWVELYPWWSRSSGRLVNFILCHNLETLIWLGNEACLELHPWLSSVNTIDFPDFVVFDLDPAPPAGFAEAREVALILRGLLVELQLQGWVKTSGATGVHVYLPVEPRYSYRQTRELAKKIAEMIKDTIPDKVTLERSVRERDGKVYIDYLQNVRGKTLCAPYSPRPLPGAPVSTPVAWEELEDIEPLQFNLITLPQRLKEKGDLFAPVLKVRQRLEHVLSSKD